MKNKLELYILVGLIAVLSIYIFVRQDRNINYDIPKLKSMMEEDYTMISYNGFDFTKQGDQWYIPSGFKVQESIMNRIKSEISGIKIIDMISESKDYNRFGLEDSKLLKVYKNEKLLLELNVGATSSTGNYTYIKIQDRDEVYSIRGDIDNNLNKSEDELRNRQVLSFNTLNELTITKGEEVIKKTESEASDILPMLKNLQASTFKDLSREKVLLTISISGDEEKSLIIYDKIESEYPATSSDVNFPFTLPSWLVEQLLDFK